MLLPASPKNQPEIWEKLATQLTSSSLCYIVSNGIGDHLAQAHIPDQNATRSLIERMQKSQFCRISANRGSTIAPHFSGTIQNNTAIIEDFICYPSNESNLIHEKEMRNEIEISAISLFFSHEKFDAMSLPLHLVPWAMEGVEISSTHNGLKFRKL